MKCPNCQSDNVQKKGKRSGKQRYRCSDCGANFTRGIEYQPAKQYPPLEEIRCPQCKGDHIIRDGKLEDGSQRYQCQSCGLNFSPKTIYTRREKIQWDCPYCGGTLIYSGYGKTGNRAYLCKDCGKSCTGNAEGKPVKKELPFNLTNKSVHCPHCGSLDLKKAGHTSQGLQRYECNNCKRAFNECSKKRKPLDKVISLILQGYNVGKVAKDSGYSPERLRKVMSPYYKAEKITNEQRTNIIRYGYYLRVPVDYMAEYVKCSEHKCKEVLRKFKKNIMSTNHDAI